MEIRLGNKTIKTKCDKGDHVYIYEKAFNSDGTRDIMKSVFYLEEKNAEGENLSVTRPLEYVVDDIELSCSSGNYSYRMHYRDKTCVFPYGCVGDVTDDRIAKILNEKSVEVVSEDLYEHIRNAQACVEEALKDDGCLRPKDKEDRYGQALWDLNEALKLIEKH